MGTNEWNPAHWISDCYAWDKWADAMLYGPLSADGPLGESGPYTPQAYYNGQVFYDNEFAPHTRAMGVWGVLGAIGPLGAVGALGALGPIGATGYVRNRNGQYVDSANTIHTSYDVPYNTSFTRSFDLYEQYNVSYALSSSSVGAANPKVMSILNSSFFVEDDCCAHRNHMNDCIPWGYTIHNYTIESTVDQIITIVVVPISLETNGWENDNVMYLQLCNHDGIPIDGLNTFVSSELYMNFIQFTAHANDQFIVQVMPSVIALKGSYRLYVTGSYNELNQYNFENL